VLLIAVNAAVFAAFSAALAAGKASVPTVAFVAVSTDLIIASDAFFACCKPAAEPEGIPRHAGKFPMKTLGLPGPPVKTGGIGWDTLSVTLAAGLPMIRE
jgi:hypothetical protein